FQQDVFLDELFERMPESKFELIDGRFIVGNCLAGSRLLLRQLLHGWGFESAVALSSREECVEALCRAYSLPMPDDIDSPDSLKKQFAGIDYRYPDSTAGREGDNAGNWQMRQHLLMSMHVAGKTLGGEALGRDFAMKIGEDCLSPDFLYFKATGPHKLYDYYLDGPADLVIEVVLPAHETADREIKRELYARAGVPEYALASPAKREIEFLRLVGGEYRRVMPDADGKYRPSSVPGLAIALDQLWPDEHGWDMEKQPFLIEDAPETPVWARSKQGWGWRRRKFAPKISLWPKTLSFADFISWCPETKIEFWDGRPQICGREGSRNVIAMLMQTFGLIEVSRLVPPLDWLAAIESSWQRENNDRTIRELWRQKANDIAAMLRREFGLQKIALTGDLLKSKTINYWSELGLAISGLERAEHHKIYEALLPYHDQNTQRINFYDADDRYFKERMKVCEWQLEEL
ncbi:MAG TPA: Uma2 family endonuclease, partial [Blastocatellia bacterium]|nr:Uma2 family endonuclease [Blastocatellia bacterium]